MTWTDDERNVALDGRDNGLSNRQISEALDYLGYARSTDAVRRFLHRNPQLQHPEPDWRAVEDTTNDDSPKTIVEMAEAIGIDINEYEVLDAVANRYGPHWQTKVRFKPNVPEILGRTTWDDLLEQRRRDVIDDPVMLNSKIHEGQLIANDVYEIFITDAHLGSLAWGPEAGHDYDLDIAIARYERAFLDLLSRRPDSTNILVFPVGNDLLHVDTTVAGKGGATTKGTPQDVDTRWMNLFVRVSRMLEDLIRHAAKDIYEIHVPIVPGNHDTERTFYLGQWLAATFDHAHRIHIDNSPKSRKYFQYGDITIGFTHGDKEKPQSLYRLMTEETDYVTTHREWHLGHKHQELTVEHGTMRIRTLPALASNDAWHNQQGYKALPGARAFHWNPSYGLQAIYCHNVQEDYDDGSGSDCDPKEASY